MDELLMRYNDKQKETINKYWEVIRWTRKHGKIADKIKLAEMEYWNKYETDIVISALETHIEKYPKVRENYTRGIIRNKAEQKALGVCAEASAAPRKTAQRTNKFCNYQQRDDWDYDTIEKQAAIKNNAEADTNRDGLINDPRFSKRLDKLR